MSASYGNEAPVRGATVTTAAEMMGIGSHVHSRISWGAIIGGVILAISAQILFSLLGAGIGLDTVNVTSGTTPTASSFGMGAGIWWIVTSFVTLACASYCAAWMAGVELRWDGLLHGLITWGLATMLTVWLLSSAIGGILGGGASVLGGLVSAAGSGLKEVTQPVAQAAGISPNMIQQQADAFLKPSNPDPASMSPQDAVKTMGSDLVTYAKGGPDAAAAKTQMVAIMAAQQHISVDAANKKFESVQAKLDQEKAEAVQTAKRVADAAATAASHASIAVFVDLLVGALAAAIGGALAVQRRARTT